MAGVCHASTILFFLIPESTTPERPIALLPTFIRWWEWLRAPAVVEWKGRHNVTWDASCGARMGDFAFLETLNLQEGHAGIGATTLVVDLAKAFEKVHLSVVWNWALYLTFGKEC